MRAISNPFDKGRTELTLALRIAMPHITRKLPRPILAEYTGLSASAIAGVVGGYATLGTLLLVAETVGLHYRIVLDDGSSEITIESGADYVSRLHGQGGEVPVFTRRL